MVHLVGGIPERVHVHPVAESVVPKAFLSVFVRMRVRAKLPLRISIVVGVQSYAGLKCLAHLVSPWALIRDISVLAHVICCVSLIPT